MSLAADIPSSGSHARRPGCLAVRFGVAVGAVAAMCLWSGCNQRGVPPANNQQPSYMREFRLKNEKVVIGEADLEGMRRAVIERLATEDSEPNRFMIRELEGAIAVIGPEDSRLGCWELTVRDGRLALVRVPPRGVMNLLFVAVLANESARWKVTEFSEERMSGQ